MAHYDETNHDTTQISEDALCHIARNIVTKLPNVFYVVSVSDYRFVYLNKIALEIMNGFGIEDQDEVLGQHPWDIFPDWEQAGLSDIYEEVRERKRILHLRQQKYEHLGRTTYWEGWLIPHTDRSTGEVVSISALWMDVTIHKDTENALRVGEERLRTFVNNTTAVIYLKDLNSRFIFINTECAKVMGTTTEEAVGRSDSDFFPPEVAKCHVTNDRRVADSGVHIEFEESVPQSDGIHTFLSVKFPLRDSSGSIYAIGGVSTDISERKRSEEYLQRYRFLSERARDIILFIRLDGRILEANSAALNTYGYTYDELTSMNIVNLRLLGEREKVRAQIEMADKEGALFEAIHVRKDGSTFPAEISARSAVIGNERVLLSIIRDISDRRQTEAALKESEEKYRELVERANEGIVVIQDTLIKFANPRFEELSGYNIEQLTNTPFTDYLTPGEKALLLDRYNRRMRGEAVPGVYEIGMTRKDGSQIEVEISAGVITYECKPADMVLFRDIRERKRAEYALDAERRRLSAVLDALPVGVFVTNASGGFIYTNKMLDEIWGGNLPPVISIEDYDYFTCWKQDTNEKILPQEWSTARVLSSGETCPGETIGIQRLDGTTGTIYTSAAPVKDAQGEIIGAVGVADDITEMVALRHALEVSLEEEKHESQRAIALEGVAEAGISTLQLQDLLDTLAQRISNGLKTHSCTIMILEDDTGEFVTQAAFNVPEECGFRIQKTEGFVGKLFKERRTIYIEDAEREQILELDPHIKISKTKSLLGTPLTVRGRVIGVTFVDTQEKRHFCHDDIRLLEAMASRAAMAIDNTRLYADLTKSRNELSEALEREKQISYRLQRALLPGEPVVGDGYTTVVRYLPDAKQDIGGDFYDVFKTLDGKVGILIGDVSGKGINAASIAAATRSTVRAMVYSSSIPSWALSSANTVLYPQQPDIEAFVTMFLAILDMPTGQLSYVSAGHPPVAIRRADGNVEWLKTGQPPVGLLEQLDYDESSSELAYGDKIILYTDGISESRKGTDMLGTEGLESILNEKGHMTPDDLADEILRVACDWADGAITDDAAIIVVERQVTEGFTLSLP